MIRVNIRHNNATRFMGFCALVFLLIVAIRSFFTKKIANSHYTIGMIERFSAARSGTDANVIYTVNGIEYTCFTMETNGMAIGDKFQIEYDTNNPEECIVHLEQPIFLPDEKTAYAVGTIVRINSYNNKVRFEYNVGTQLFRKFQKLPKKNNLPEKGSRFRVRYSPENPQRSIIFVDTPLS